MLNSESDGFMPRSLLWAIRRQVFFGGRAWPLSLVDPLHVEGEGDEDKRRLACTDARQVIALLAQQGVPVAKGTPLLVMEAMKMEHTISALRDGLVKEFRFSPGDQVADGAELVQFEAAQ